VLWEFLGLRFAKYKEARVQLAGKGIVTPSIVALELYWNFYRKHENTI